MVKNNVTKFSISGSGYFVKLFDAEHQLYTALKTVNPEFIHNTLFNIEQFKKLNLKRSNGVVYNSYLEIEPTETFTVYALDALTRLEMRREKYKSIKIMFRDFAANDFLFPPEYEITRIELQSTSLQILEFDKGNFGTSTFPKYFENTDKLSFETLYIPHLKQHFIKTIKANNQVLSFKKLDTLNYGGGVWIDEL